MKKRVGQVSFSQLIPLVILVISLMAISCAGEHHLEEKSFDTYKVADGGIVQSGKTDGDTAQSDAGKLPPPPARPGAVKGEIGAPCNSDLECVSGTCVLGGIIPGGYCSQFHCTGSSKDYQCPEGVNCQPCLGASVCVFNDKLKVKGPEGKEIAGISLCLPQCDLKEGRFCRKKVDNQNDDHRFVCQPLPEGKTGICKPRCYSDLDCPAGAVCNPGTGICGVVCKTDGSLKCELKGTACTPTTLSPTGGFCMKTCNFVDFEHPRADCAKKDEVCQPVPGVGAICKPPYTLETECPAGAVLHQGVCG